MRSLRAEGELADALTAQESPVGGVLAIHEDVLGIVRRDAIGADAIADRA